MKNSMIIAATIAFTQFATVSNDDLATSRNTVPYPSTTPECSGSASVVQRTQHSLMTYAPDFHYQTIAPPHEGHSTSVLRESAQVVERETQRPSTDSEPQHTRFTNFQAATSIEVQPATTSAKPTVTDSETRNQIILDSRLGGRRVY